MSRGRTGGCSLHKIGEINNVLELRRKIDINGRIQIPSAMREKRIFEDGNEVVIAYTVTR